MDDLVQGDQLRSIVERIERLEEEKKTISDDIKEVYAEAKANGYDVKVLRKAVALRKRDANERAEEEAILDLYMQAIGELADTPLGRAAAPGYSSSAAMARSAPSYPERVSRPVAVDQPAHFPPGRAPQSGHHGSDSEGVAGGESPHLMSGSEQGSVEAPQARNEPGSDGATSGGGGVKASPETPRFALPAAKPLRPNCLKPEACAGMGAKHCFTCTQAVNEARQPAYEEA